ncbi:hypothetical protein SO694_00022032 [Aureococcus anophagefferens]|uniref:F-box domain-containing protein n=1 Tax=Aureococcus anophagefferens TaxID=44056 RepID=A0ABR1FT01_AURAN
MDWRRSEPRPRESSAASASSMTPTDQRIRSDSLWSAASGYSYASDDTNPLAPAAADRGTLSHDGRADEARQLSQAMAASLHDEAPDDAAPAAGPPSFFSALGAPLDVQLRVAASLTSVADMVNLEATSKWARRPMWRAATISSVGGFAPRIESLSLTEAAAATLVTDHLRVPRCLPPTTSNARYVNRLSLLRVASVESAGGYDVVVAPSADAAARGRRTRRGGPPGRPPFDDPAALRVNAHRIDDDGFLALRASFPWRALVLDAENGAVRVLLADNIHGWVKNHVVANRSFPLKSPRAAASTSDAFFLGSHLDRWAKLAAT